MQSKQPDNTASRRDFFRSILGKTKKDQDTKSLNSEANKAMKRRASVIALRYAQKEADLTQIGVQEPTQRGTENHLYSVRINGYTPDSVSVGLELHVDIAKGLAEIPEPEFDD